MNALVLAFLICVPNVHMMKAEFLDCVHYYPDEYKVAQQYGIPKQIEKKTPGDPSESEYDWVYIHANGEVDRFSFGTLGQLMMRATYVPPSPH
jgi:hypothetical protein